MQFRLCRSTWSSQYRSNRKQLNACQGLGESDCLGLGFRRSVGNERVLELATITRQHSEPIRCLSCRSLCRCCYNEKTRANETAQREKVFAAKPAEPTFEFPPQDSVSRREPTHKLPSDLCVHTITLTRRCIHTETVR